MTAKMDAPVESRILQLFQHLGIRKAHFAGSVTGDWHGLAARDRIGEPKEQTGRAESKWAGPDGVVISEPGRAVLVVANPAILEFLDKPQMECMPILKMKGGKWRS